MQNVSLSEQLENHRENRERLNEFKQVEAETWEFVLMVAKGCFDYGGGYRSDDEKLRIFHHGIETVITALTTARDKGTKDSQVAALYAIGRDETNRRDQSEIEAATIRLVIKDTYQPPIDTPASITWHTHQVFDPILAAILRAKGYGVGAGQYHTLEVVGAEIPSESEARERD